MTSYVTIPEADQIISGLAPTRRTTWATLTDQDKSALLSHAQSILDTSFEYVGKATDVNQGTAWPRDGARYYDPMAGAYMAVDKNTIPDRMKRATALLALHLADYAADIFSHVGLTPTSISIGSMSVGGMPGKVPRIPYEVINLVKPLTVNGGRRFWFASN